MRTCLRGAVVGQARRARARDRRARRGRGRGDRGPGRRGRQPRRRRGRRLTTRARDSSHRRDENARRTHSQRSFPHRGGHISSKMEGCGLEAQTARGSVTAWSRVPRERQLRARGGLAQRNEPLSCRAESALGPERAERLPADSRGAVGPKREPAASDRRILQKAPASYPPNLARENTRSNPSPNTRSNQSPRAQGTQTLPTVPPPRGLYMVADVTGSVMSTHASLRAALRRGSDSRGSARR